MFIILIALIWWLKSSRIEHFYDLKKMSTASLFSPFDEIFHSFLFYYTCIQVSSRYISKYMFIISFSFLKKIIYNIMGRINDTKNLPLNDVLFWGFFFSFTDIKTYFRANKIIAISIKYLYLQMFKYFDKNYYQ